MTIAGDAPIVAEAREVLASGVRRIATEIRASLDFHRRARTARGFSASC